MEYLDPIETARRVLAGEPIEEETDAIIEDVIEDDDAVLFFEDEDLEEGKKKAHEDDEDEDEDEEETEEGYGSIKSGKKVPAFLKKKKKL